MSALYGRMQPDDRNVVTRRAHHSLTMLSETWDGQCRTVLFRDGTVRVYVEAKGASMHSSLPVFEGNVNERAETEDLRAELIEARQLLFVLRAKLNSCEHELAELKGEKR